MLLIKRMNTDKKLSKGKKIKLILSFWTINYLKKYFSMKIHMKSFLFMKKENYWEKVHFIFYILISFIY